MKPTCRLFAFLLVLAMLLTNSGMTALAEAVLTMPAALEIIDEEAFYGSTSIDKVVLSDKVTEIRARAFANSTLSEINLPDSLTFIDESAFDGPDKVKVTVNEGSWAYDWAMQNEYITAIIDDTVYYDYSIQNGMCTITKYKGSDSSVIIPSIIENCPVTTIGSNAFDSNEALISVSIPDTVTRIDENAFYGCFNLEQITLPNNLQYIGSKALGFCWELTTISLPGTLEFIADDVFDWSYKLARVSAPANSYAYTWAVRMGYIINADTSIDSFTYQFSNNQCTITGYNGNDMIIAVPCEIDNKPVTSISSSAFSYSEVRSVSLPSSILSIGKNAFEYCYNLTFIELPSSLTSIPNNCFLGCQSLTEIQLPNTITSIGSCAFDGCVSLKDISFSAGLKTIGWGAFGGCKKIKNMVLPESVTSIGACAFDGCESVRLIYIPDSATLTWKYREILSVQGSSYSYYDHLGMFMGCSSLEQIHLPSTCTTIGSCAFWYCSSLETVNLPTNLSKIECSFGNNDSLRQIVIPKNVSSIGVSSSDYVSDGVFFDCKSLKSILVQEGSSYYYSKNGVLFNKSGSKLIRYPAGKTDVFYAVPNEVTAIGTDAFNGTTFLEKVFIGSNVCSISDNAFEHCNDGLIIYGESGSYIEAYAEQHNISFIAEEMPTPVADRYSLMGHVISNTGVGISGVLVYLIDSQDNETLLGTAMTDTSGRWNIDNLTACSSAYLYFYSPEYEIENNGYSVSITNSQELNPFYATLISTVPTEKTIGFTTPTNGSTIPYDSALELTWNSVDGASKYVYSARWIDQEEAFIYRKSTTGTSATIAASQMQSGKTLQLWVAAFDSDENQLCQQIIRVTTTAASGDMPAPTVAPTVVSGYFTMKQNGKEVSQVKAGEDIDFVVDVPGASTIQIVVDGKAYESYAVTNDRASFTRSFSSSGTRTVQFRPHNLKGWEGLTEAKTLTVTAVDTLSAPVIKTIRAQIMKQDARITWNTVNNASYYTVYLYHNDVQLWPSETNPWESRTSNTYITIPGMWLAEEGTYYVSIVASGINYSSATANATFTVRPTDQAVEITYPTAGGIYNIGDTMHTNVACYKENMYTRLRVVDPDGGITDYNSDDNGVFYPIAEKPGTYQLTAFASSKSTFTYEGREATSTTVSVTVKGPTVTSLVDRWGNGYAVAYTNDTTWVTATINCDGEVEAFIDNVSKGKISPSEEGGREYKFTVGNLSDGAHSVKLRVSYNGYYSDSQSIAMFSITKQPEQTKYATRTAVFKTKPVDNTGTIVTYGKQVTYLGTYASNYSYVRFDGNYGFIETDALLAHLEIDSSSITGAISSSPYLVSINETVNYTLTTEQNVKEVTGILYHTTPNRSKTTSTLIPATMSGDNSALIRFVPSAEGIYYLTLQVMSITGDVTYISEYDQSYIVITPLNGNRNVYRNVETRDILYSTPYSIAPLSIEIDDQKPMKVIAEYGDYYYVQYTADFRTIKGFVFVDDVSIIINPVNRRAYVLASSQIYNEDIRRTQNTMDVMLKLFGEVNISFDSIESNRNITLQGMISFMESISKIADYNDETYIYIFSHGDISSNGKIGMYLDNDGEMEGDYIVFSYETFVKQYVSKVKGKVVLIMQPCYSGGIIEPANTYLDKERFAIITSSSANETSAGWKFDIPSFTRDLYNACVNTSIASDGIITLEEILNEIPKRTLYAITAINTEHTQIYGNPKTRIF